MRGEHRPRPELGLPAPVPDVTAPGEGSEKLVVGAVAAPRPNGVDDRADLASREVGPSVKIHLLRIRDGLPHVESLRKTAVLRTASRPSSRPRSYEVPPNAEWENHPACTSPVMRRHESPVHPPILTRRTPPICLPPGNAHPKSHAQSGENPALSRHGSRLPLHGGRMITETSELQVFHCVVKHASYTRAADELG